VRQIYGAFSIFVRKMALAAWHRLAVAVIRRTRLDVQKAGIWKIVHHSGRPHGFNLVSVCGAIYRNGRSGLRRQGNRRNILRNGDGLHDLCGVRLWLGCDCGLVCHCQSQNNKKKDAP
jgi:hypothetical protein